MFSCTFARLVRMKCDEIKLKIFAFEFLLKHNSLVRNYTTILHYDRRKIVQNDISVTILILYVMQFSEHFVK